MSVRRNRTLAAAASALIAMFVLAGAASAATVAVQSLKPPFEASNSTVTKTPDGVHFGTYADGGAIGGSLRYSGFNGHKLSEVSDFGYTFTYREAGSTSGPAPYARIFLDTNTAVDSDPDGNPANDVDADVVLDPGFCGTAVPPQATDVTFNMNTSTVRYNDDACKASPKQPFAVVKAAHPNDTIVSMLVTQGFSTGTDVSALLRSMSVNGTTFAFDVAPADGATGAVGPAGPAGPAAPTTTVSNSGQSKSCLGAAKRTIHAPTRAGQTFLSARAALRGTS